MSSLQYPMGGDVKNGTIIIIIYVETESSIIIIADYVETNPKFPGAPEPRRGVS